MKTMDEVGNELTYTNDKGEVDYHVEIPEGDYLLVTAHVERGGSAANFDHPNILQRRHEIISTRGYWPNGHKRWFEKPGHSLLFAIPKDRIEMIEERGYSYVPVNIGGQKYRISCSGGTHNGWTDFLTHGCSVGIFRSQKGLKTLAENAIMPTDLDLGPQRVMEEHEKDHNVYEPKDERDLHNIRVSGVLAEQASCDNWRICHLEYLISAAHEVLTEGKFDQEAGTRLMEDLNRHIEQRTKRERMEKAERLGLSVEDLMELSDHMRNLLEEDSSESKRECPTMNLQKAEKLENGMFRITLQSDVVADMDYPNDKAYMVYDPYEKIAPGTERDDWGIVSSSRMNMH